MEKAMQELLDRVPHIDISGMSYETWLENRKSSIGGSDAGAIMGYIGEWGSPLTVFLNKKGLAVSKDISPAAKRGKLLEPIIRDYFSQEYPALIIEKVPFMFYSPEHPFMSANLDGVIFAEQPVTINGKEIQGLGGLEIKSSKTGYGFGPDEIPDGHYAQVQHYMAVTGLSWFVLSAYFLEDEDIGYYVILRDEAFIADLIKEEKAFWENHILTGEWPAAVGIEAEEEMVTGMFTGGSALALGDEERELCRGYVDAHERFKAAEADKKRIATNLKEIIIQKQSGNTKEKKISAYAGRYSISWSRFMRKDVDVDLLKKAGLYEKYVKVSESGQMRITEKKEA
jgi:putative phage-type endonuclease